MGLSHRSAAPFYAGRAKLAARPCKNKALHQILTERKSEWLMFRKEPRKRRVFLGR
ncbi:hypothetical protein SS05631_c30650 [Sinorhizobium sp. CCBAU 05631]|nr:hypothetical protein SS05631_c30650 [Sinorhizobium sp. CCBAU 05631]